MLGLWRVVVLVTALLEAVLGQTNTTQSGCEVCASTGDCAKAYGDAPGQFCGNWLDRQNDRRPCCCPDDAVCKIANYACNCGYSGSRRAYRTDDVGSGLLWLWSLLGSLALLMCCCGSCFMASKRLRNRRNQDNTIPVAAPVVSPVDGGVSSQPYTAAYARESYGPGYTAATPAYSRYYGQSRGGSGMGAGTGAALGGTAGLLGGLMLGEALADRGNYYGNGGVGGDFDGGGCDFGGDF